MDLEWLKKNSATAEVARGLIDRHSRYVLGWRLSNTLDGSFCVDLLREVLGAGKPEVFDTDQGVQFTAAAIGMDGRGRCLDNIFVERLWRSVKYEDVFIKRYEVVPELRAGLARYFGFYDEGHRHQSPGYRTPAEAYRAMG